MRALRVALAAIVAIALLGGLGVVSVASDPVCDTHSGITCCSQSEVKRHVVETPSGNTNVVYRISHHEWCTDDASGQLLFENKYWNKSHSLNKKGKTHVQNGRHTEETTNDAGDVVCTRWHYVWIDGQAVFERVTISDGPCKKSESPDF